MKLANLFFVLPLAVGACSDLDANLGTTHGSADPPPAAAPLVGMPRWATTLGGSDIDFADTSTIAVTAAGDVVVGGNVELPDNAGFNAFVASLAAADGSVQWTQSFTDAGLFTAAASPDGNVAIAGNSGLDWFVAVYSSTGDLVWQEQHPETGLECAANGAAFSADGSVLYVGGWQGYLTDHDGVLVAYDAATGAREWTKLTGQDIEKLALAPNGDLVLDGADDTGAVVARYTPAGEQVWSHALDANASNPGAVAFDANGDVVVTGVLADEPGATWASFLGTIAADGSGDWTSQHIRNVGTMALAATPDGIVIGGGMPNLTYGATLGSTHVTQPILLAGFTAPGDAPVEAYGFGAPSNLYGEGITGLATGPNGELAVVATFAGSVDFGTGTLHSAGASDLAVVILEPSDSQ